MNINKMTMVMLKAKRCRTSEEIGGFSKMEKK